MTEPEDQLRRAADHRAGRVGAFTPDVSAPAGSGRPWWWLAAAAVVLVVAGLGAVLWSGGDDGDSGPADDPEVEIDDSPPTTSLPPPDTTAGPDPVVAGDGDPTSLCSLVAVDRGEPPTDPPAAEGWVEAVEDALGLIDPTVPAELLDAWNAATAGARTLAADVRAAGFDVNTLDLADPRYRRDLESRAQLEAWCEQQQAAAATADEPCGAGESWAVGDLDGDGLIDRVVRTGDTVEQTDVVICLGHGAEHPATLTGGWVSAWLEDLDHDGRDEVLTFDAIHAPFRARLHVYADAENVELLPVAGADGDPFPLDYTFDGLNEDPAYHAADDDWFGCVDLDGSGDEQLVVGAFTHDLADEVVSWELAPLTWTGPDATLGPTVTGSFPLAATEKQNADFRMPGRWFCQRTEAVAASLGPVAPILLDDIVIATETGVRIVRDGEPIGVAYDGVALTAHHDLAGGLVISPGVDTIVHLPVDGPPVMLTEFDGSGVHHALMDVVDIDGVPTVLATRFVEAGARGAGALALIPLDGSPRTTLPAEIYEDSGLRDVEWDGEKMILVEGSEGDVRARGMDLAGGNVTLSWNEWPEGSVPERTSMALADGVVWLVWPASDGLVEVWGRDVVDGSNVAAFNLRLLDDDISDVAVDALGDQLVITTWTGSGRPSVHLLDTGPPEVAELPIRGVATVG